jgi:hypothetical protein
MNIYDYEKMDHYKEKKYSDQGDCKKDKINISDSLKRELAEVFQINIGKYIIR